VLLIEEDAAGPLVKLRVSGMLAGLTEVLPSFETVQTIHLDGRGSLEYSLDLVRRHLRRSPVQRTVVLATNDPSALGSIRAFEECGREHSCCVMGQNASREARMELRRKHTSLVGSVGYFPERYGDEVIRLAASILQGHKVPPAVFAKHELITSENVGRIYPLDELVPEALSSSAV
jgi:ribose transport system substrate-binding protein